MANPASQPNNATNAQGNVAPGKRSGDKLIVLCGIPGGLRLRAHSMTTFKETNAHGVDRNISIAEASGEGDIILNSPTLPFGTVPAYEILGEGRTRFAVTRNVDKDHYEAWLKHNAKAPYVVNGLVKAFNSLDDARSAVKDMGGHSGLEPINPDKDPRMSKSLKTFVQEKG